MTARAQLKPGSQASRILGYLATGRTLTVMDAIRKWGCTTLSQRCTELRERGHAIRSRMVVRNGKRVAEQYLKRAP